MKHDDELANMLRYLDGILAIDPEAHEERWVRAVFRFQAGRNRDSVADCDFLLEQNPPGADLDRPVIDE